MPKVSTRELSDKLKIYQYHGLDVHEDGSDKAVCDCPFCGREGKFYMQVKDGLWQCKVCAEGSDKGGGNEYTFLRLLWEKSMEGTTDGQLQSLKEDRRLLEVDTLRRWGACRSLITGEWILPGYNESGRINQMYRYIEANGRKALFGTPGMSHGLFGMSLFDKTKVDTYLCEGPWDAMALWEVMKSTKHDAANDLVPTGAEASSLISGANILATPSCNVFRDSWRTLFTAKNTYLLFDSDHPRETSSGTPSPPAGYHGMQRVTGILANAVEKDLPASIGYFFWGKDGYDPELPSGTDIRDLLTKDAPTIRDRCSFLGEVLERIVPTPSEWFTQNTKGSSAASDVQEILPIPCKSWNELTDQWRIAMEWIPGLDCGLSVMLACIVSTPSPGDQLWVKIIGPASCGKTTLAEAVSVCKRYVQAMSTFRGFHSGFRGKNGEDNGMVGFLKDKTLVVKDADTLLTAPNRAQILSEMRDLYDRTSRIHYRTGVRQDHDNISMTIILCGTPSLYTLDAAELGDRFVDCVILHKMTPELEYAIGLKNAMKQFANLGRRTNSDKKSQYDPQQAKAMGLTGGYVEYLYENGEELFSQVSMNTDPEFIKECVDLGTFVAFMRARPSVTQAEVSGRELNARLSGQFVRLAGCLAVVLNRKSVDGEVMSRVRKIALDTACGRTFDLTAYMSQFGMQGLEISAIQNFLGGKEDASRAYIRFLNKVELLESYVINLGAGMTKTKWRLSQQIRRLYSLVVKDTTTNGKH